MAHSAFVFAKRQGMAQEHVAEAQTIEIDALRQLGDMLKATERATAGRPKLISSKMEPIKDNNPTLADLGINKKTSSLAQKLADLPEAEVTTIKSSVKTGKSITKAAKDTDKKIKKDQQKTANAKLAEQVPDQEVRYQLHHARQGASFFLGPPSFRKGM